MPRSRCMGGCANCRRHHVKCDQARPYCYVCLKHGRKCGGYERNIIFHGDTGQGPPKIRSQLFTEDEQQRTSEVLIANVPGEDTTQVIQNIDLLVESSSADFQASGQITRGPFGAFQLPASGQSLNVDSFSNLLEINDDANLSNLDTIFALGISVGEHDPTNSEPALVPNAMSALPMLPAIDYIVDETPHCWTEDDSTQSGFQFMLKDGPTPTQFRMLNPVDQQNAVLHEAPFLLKNYLDSVIKSQTPVQSDKTPWHILFFAHAKDAYATMTLAKAPDPASLCVFYAILAISAFSHRTSSDSQRWHQLASQYRANAKTQMQRTWLDAFCIPKKLKYKAVLMALLAMIQVSAFAGDFNEAERYLLDTEKFIRLCGLTKPSKSRRVRLLHHCYSFPRIFYESTFALAGPGFSPHQLALGPCEGLSTLVPEQDSPQFKLGRWRELNENMTEIKSKESGENDLHLERPGLWAATLYPDIFGIPESLMVLLSQAIRLGNERLAMERDEAGLSFKEFSSRARSLEYCIMQWRSHTLKDKLNWDPRLGIETASADRQAVIRNMLEAMCEALSIYFYRRVYNLHPSLLQDKVRAVRDGLLRCDQSGDKLHHTAGFSWPAFIAACEAADPALQASFSMWFKARIQNVGLPCFSIMLEVVQKVWRKNQGDLDQDWTSWWDVLQLEDIRFFYS